MERSPKDKNKLNERRRACESKIGYLDRSEARKRRRYLLKRYGWNNRVYKCAFCPFYHLASKRGAKTSRISGDE